MSTTITDPTAARTCALSAFDRFYNHGHQPKDAIDLAIADASHRKLSEFYDALVEYRTQHTSMLKVLEAMVERNERTGRASYSLDCALTGKARAVIAAVKA